jgi:hypothetical protein
MAKNRKSQPAAVRFGPALKALVICLLIGGSGVGYVWQKEQILRLGLQRKSRETQRAKLQEQNDKLRNQLDKMRSVKVLEGRIKDLKLGLVPQQPEQVLRLPEPSAGVTMPRREQPYLLQASHAPESPLK